MAGETIINLHPDTRAAWVKDKVKIKFFNQETKEDITLTVNGQVFFLKHNAIQIVPRAVHEAIMDAVITIWELNDESIMKAPVKYEEPRMMSILIDEETEKRLAMTKKQAAISQVLQEEQLQTRKERRHATQEGKGQESNFEQHQQAPARGIPAEASGGDSHEQSREGSEEKKEVIENPNL